MNEGLNFWMNKYTEWVLMSDGSLVCTDRRDILAKHYVYY